MNVILASKSPRRKELMDLLGIDYEIMVSEADESIEEGLTLEEQSLDEEQLWNNVNEAIGQQPNTNTYKVAEGAGSKTIKLTRSKSSTNVFISKFIITRGGTDGIQNVEVVTPANNVIYNLSGQKVDASYKGIIIVNGKKVVVGNR